MAGVVEIAEPAQLQQLGFETRIQQPVVMRRLRVQCEDPSMCGIELHALRRGTRQRGACTVPTEDGTYAAPATPVRLGAPGGAGWPDDAMTAIIAAVPAPREGVLSIAALHATSAKVHRRRQDVSDTRIRNAYI